MTNGKGTIDLILGLAGIILLFGALMFALLSAGLASEQRHPASNHDFLTDLHGSAN